MNNVITAPGVPSETDVWLGRPWHNFPKTVFINTKAEVTIPAKGWYDTMGGLPVLWADYNTVDAQGNPVDLSHRQDTYWYLDDSKNRVEGKAKNFLTDEEAAQYTVKNVLSGDDNWQPELLTEACEAPQPQISGGKIKWNAVPYAICYVITKNGKVEGFTTATSCEYVDGNEYSIQAANEYGGLSKPALALDMADVDSVENSAKVFNASSAYTLDGKNTNGSHRGITILTDGETSVKVLRK